MVGARQLEQKRRQRTWVLCKDMYELSIEDRALGPVFSVKSQAWPAVKEGAMGMVSG